MRKYVNVVLGVFLTVIVLSCSKDKSEPNFVQIDTKSYNLNTGIIEEKSTNNNYRPYGIILQSAESNPSAYITFELYSSNTAELATGTYTYTWDNYAANKFSYLNYGKDLVWNNSVPTGTFFAENSTNVIAGSKITVSRNSNDNYVFNLDIKVKDASNNTIAITGKFSEVLTAGYIPYWAIN